MGSSHESNCVSTVWGERGAGGGGGGCALGGCWNCVLQSFCDGYTATEQAMCGARRQTQLCRFVCRSTIRLLYDSKKQLEPLMQRHKVTWKHCWCEQNSVNFWTSDIIFVCRSTIRLLYDSKNNWSHSCSFIRWRGNTADVSKILLIFGLVTLSLSADQQ